MADNIDPEQIRKMAEAMEEYARVMGRTSGLTQEQIRTINALNKATSDVTNSTKKFGEAQDKSKDAVYKFEKAINTGVGTLGSFFSTVQNGEKTFSKYNSTIDRVGDTAADLGKNFGLLGTALGLAVKAITSVVGSVNQFNDRLVKSFDQVSEVGASAEVTAGQLYNFGRAAGFSSSTLGQFSKAASDSSEALVSMGGSVGAGVKTFSEFVNVGEEGLKTYRQLGFTQEALTEAMAKNLQALTGAGIGLNKPVKDLQKQSLQYLDTLVALSDLTGQSVKKLQEQQDFANANASYQLKMFALGKERDQAEARGDANRVKELDLQIQKQREFATGIAGLPKVTQTALLNYYASGGKVMQQGLAGFLSLGGNLPGVLKKFQDSTVSAADATQYLRNEVKGTVNKFSDSFSPLIGTEGFQDLRDTFIGGPESVVVAGQQMGAASKKQAQEILDGITAQKNGRDKIVSGMADLESTERKLQRALDDATQAFNPLTNELTKVLTNFGLLAAAIAGASFALMSLTRTALTSAAEVGGAGAAGRAGGLLGGGAAGKGPGGLSEAEMAKYKEARAAGRSNAEALNAARGMRGVPGGAAPEPPTTGGTAGRLRAGAGRIGANLGAAGAAGIAGYAASELGDSVGGTGGAAIGVAGSALQGAAMGAMIGPWGAVIGGLVGLGKGLLDNKEKLFSNTEALQSSGDLERSLADARAENQKLLTQALTANTEATEDNTEATPSAPGTPSAKPPGVPEAKPKTQEDILAEIGSNFSKNYTAAYQKWNTTQEATLADMEQRAADLKKKYSKMSVIGGGIEGPGTLVESWENEGAKKAYSEAQKRISELKAVRDNRNKELESLKKDYEQTIKQWQDIKEQLRVQREFGIGLADTTMEAAAATAGAAGPQTQGGKGTYTVEDLANQGLEVRGYGDTQAPGAEVDNRLINLAKRIQTSIPGFKYFSGFNDKWHQREHPGSKHTKGMAVDFTLDGEPTREEGAALVRQLKDMGFSYAQDEYNNPSSFATGGHMHAQLAQGGIVTGPTKALIGEAGRNELVQPLNKSSMLEKLASTPAGQASDSNLIITKLESIMRTMSDNSVRASMEWTDKLNRMIDILENSHTTQEKLLRVTRI